MQAWPLCPSTGGANSERKIEGVVWMTDKRGDNGVVWMNAKRTEGEKPKPRPYKRKQCKQTTWADPVTLVQNSNTAETVPPPAKKQANRKTFQVQWKAPTANFHLPGASAPKINPIAFIPLPNAPVCNKKLDEFVHVDALADSGTADGSIFDDALCDEVLHQHTDLNELSSLMSMLEDTPCAGECDVKQLPSLTLRTGAASPKASSCSASTCDTDDAIYALHPSDLLQTDPAGDDLNNLLLETASWAVPNLVDEYFVAGAD